MSQIDKIYRSILLSKFFTKGWGHPENLQRLFKFRKIISDREKCQHLVQPDYPIHIDKEDVQKECRILSGHFQSPFIEHLPGIMPHEVQTAKFEMILPHTWKGPHKPVCVHLAGTGDHNFWRRRMLLARPLLKEAGIASIILENPYYGCRKPKQQTRSSLLNVSDLFVMGGALVLESLALFHWCDRQGLGPLGITGLSMGGHMASLAATNWHKPISLIPCLSWTTASAVFTQGVLSEAIKWPMLGKQYTDNSLYEKVSELIVSPERERQNPLYQLGHNFSKDYDSLNSSISHDQECGLSRAASSNQQSGGIVARCHMVVDVARSMAERYLGDVLFNFIKLANKSDMDELKIEAMHFMRGVMDECTHLGNFSIPVDPELIIIVIARSDAYVPRDSVLGLPELWPGCQVRYLDSGHISAFLFNQNYFRKAISDAFDLQIKKYHS